CAISYYGLLDYW
nr:immunoglobulin heavy chain junction region [Mus musculus]